MILVKEILEFIESSSAKSFIAICNDDEKWVIRLKKKDKNAKRLLSSYLAGILAKFFDINHPAVSLATIGDDLMTNLVGKVNIFDFDCAIGVGSKYIEDLSSIQAPKTDSFLSPDFPEINRKYLIETLSQSPNFNQIYGIKVFSHWIYLSDYHKYENFKINKKNQIYFLDFDLSFSSSIGEWGDLEQYDYLKMYSNQAPFLEGFTYDISQFEEWLNKLEKLDHDLISSSIDKIPDCWKIPERYLKNTLNFLFTNRKFLVEEFTNAIAFANELRKNHVT
ncbi:MAG: hypothetical protein KKG93_17935 [Bacteroidetes bacterium]|nr:hypothetical protein [Bacteroidota bacterium]